MTKLEIEMLERYESDCNSHTFQCYNEINKSNIARNKFLGTLTEEQLELYDDYCSLQMEIDMKELDEAVLFGFNYAKSWFQELLGIKREN